MTAVTIQVWFLVSCEMGLGREATAMVWSHAEWLLRHPVVMLTFSGLGFRVLLAYQELVM